MISPTPRRFPAAPALAAACALAAALALGGCGFLEPTVAVMYTDVPELALYAAAFNGAQSRYRVHAVYEESVSAAFARSAFRARADASLVAGRFLKGSQAKAQYQALDQLFSELLVNQSAFYPSLLELGVIDGRQLLLPVSFNLPLILFPSGLDASLSDNFVIRLDELKTLGAAFNETTRAGATTKMGFSPRWYPSFIYEALRLYGVEFAESAPLEWSQQGLEAGLKALRAWSDEANGGAAAEDDFKFKYLYVPPHRSVQEGRIRFAPNDSSRYFLIPGERRDNLSFRWLSKDGTVMAADDPVYIGIPRRARAKNAAETFLKWLYSEETQRGLLEEARRTRAMESSFGIAGGFSALRTVSEKFFPLYYPSMLGRMPPSSLLRVSPALPSAWPSMKDEAILPFLEEAAGAAPPADLKAELERRLLAWQKRRAGS